jgi:AI-2 transport protein TqsA
MSSDVGDPEPAPEAESGPFVPGSVRGATNLFAMLVTAVLLGVALFLVAWLAPVLARLGLGLFLAALAAPLFTLLQRRGLSSGIALAATIAVLVVVGAGMVLLAFTGAAALGESLVRYTDQIHGWYATTPAGTSGEIPEQLRELVPPEVLVSILATVIAVIVQVGGNLAFAIVIAALLLLDGRRLTRLVASGLGSGNPVFRETPAVVQAAITYFVVRVRVNAVTAVSLLVLMLVLAVDHALLWAVGAFFLSFVPYLGLIVALIAPTTLAFAESGPLAAGILVLGGIALNVLAENVLEPTLTGRALSLTTWLVFVMFFFWVWLIGPVGALLSMPITVLLVVTLEHNESTQWMAELLTREGDGR